MVFFWAMFAVDLQNSKIHNEVFPSSEKLFVTWSRHGQKQLGNGLRPSSLGAF